jgi:hypothetical protein
MTNNSYLIGEAKAWLRRKNGPDEIVSVLPDTENNGAVTAYELYVAYEKNPDYLGRILFDMQGYWIYDGEVLTIAEQEQLEKFIINHVETL